MNSFIITNVLQTPPPNTWLTQRFHSVHAARQRRSRRPYVQRCHGQRPNSAPLKLYTKGRYAVRKILLFCTETSNFTFKRYIFNKHTTHVSEEVKGHHFRTLDSLKNIVYILFIWLKHGFWVSTNEANTKRNSWKDDCAGACHKLYFLSSLYK